MAPKSKKGIQVHERHLDRFGRFCVHSRKVAAVLFNGVDNSENFPFPWGICTHLLHVTAAIARILHNARNVA